MGRETCKIKFPVICLLCITLLHAVYVGSLSLIMWLIMLNSKHRSLGQYKAALTTVNVFMLSVLTEPCEKQPKKGSVITIEFLQGVSNLELTKVDCYQEKSSQHRCCKRSNESINAMGPRPESYDSSLWFLDGVVSCFLGMAKGIRKHVGFLNQKENNNNNNNKVFPRDAELMTFIDLLRVGSHMHDIQSGMSWPQCPPQWGIDSLYLIKFKTKNKPKQKNRDCSPILTPVDHT